MDKLIPILMDMPGNPNWTKPLDRGGTSWLYPIMIVIGFAAAITLVCLKLWKRYKISVEPFYWFILIAVPVGIFGANFGSCVLGSPAGKPWSEFFTKFGSGLAIEWGLLFVVIAGFIYFPLVLRLPQYKVRDEFGPKPVVRKVSMWLYLDAIAPTVLLAQFLGRWGNYFNQEVYGRIVTSEGLANFLYHVLPGMYINSAWRQPLFLWEGIGNLVMFFVLYFGIDRLKWKKAGDLAGAYFAWYGLFRICLEPLRDPQYYSVATMIMSGLFIAAGVLFIVANHVFSKKWRQIKIWESIKHLFKKDNPKNKPHVIVDQPSIVDTNSTTSSSPMTTVSLNETSNDTVVGQSVVESNTATYQPISAPVEPTKKLETPSILLKRSPDEMIYYGGW